MKAGSDSTPETSAQSAAGAAGAQGATGAQDAAEVQGAAAVQRWTDATAWPMFALSIVFFVASVWLFGGEHPHPATIAALSLMIVVLWLVFIADFVIRLVLSRDRKGFLRLRWFELASLAVPYFRPFMIIAYLWRLPLFQRSAGLLRARFVLSTAIFALLFTYTGSVLVWFAERHHPKANIVDLGDAIWWGFTTITTVGYGDFVPVTTLGRTIAIALMVGGIFVIGVTSATVISLLTDQVHRLGATLERERRAHEAAHSADGPAVIPDPAAPRAGGQAPATHEHGQSRAHRHDR